MIETLVKPYSQEIHDNGTQSTIYQLDCIEGMKQYPDKHFDLAVVDPPYGISVNKMNMGGRNTVKPDKKIWDKEIPSNTYFIELFRISKYQVIWGGNYFELPTSKSFIIWDKGETMYGRDFSECEFAWCTNHKPARIFKLSPNQLNRFHPTQKPVALYDWIFKNYAKPTDKILDTHLGSGSSRIAAWKHGLDFTGYEIDSDYLRDHEKRFQNFIAQKTLF